MLAGVVVAVFTVQVEPPIDWPALIQKPHEEKRIDGPRLPSLLAAGESSSTLQEWKTARPKLLERWKTLLGKPPEKPKSLDAVVHSEERQQGFVRRIVSFLTEGDDRIRAAVLAPTDLQPNERRSAVVVFHETTPLTFRQPAGLAGDADRHFGVELVQRGFVVLCPECFILKTQGEPGPKPINTAKLQAEALKKRRPGWTGMGKLTFDASRCVDYLESLSFVEGDRIGCLGFSLGAKEVLYAVAFDPRFKAGVANEGGVGIRMSNWSDEWYLGKSINDRLAEFDHHQLLALAAPRALLVQGGGSADGDPSWPFVAAALPVYRLTGAANRIGLHDHRGKHAFPPQGRRVAYQWLDHWLVRQMPEQ